MCTIRKIIRFYDASHNYSTTLRFDDAFKGTYNKHSISVVDNSFNHTCCLIIYTIYIQCKLALKLTRGEVTERPIVPLSKLYLSSRFCLRKATLANNKT
jgi:hypothetical protein